MGAFKIQDHQAKNPQLLGWAPKSSMLIMLTAAAATTDTETKHELKNMKEVRAWDACHGIPEWQLLVL